MTGVHFPLFRSLAPAPASLGNNNPVIIVIGTAEVESSWFLGCWGFSSSLGRLVGQEVLAGPPLTILTDSHRAVPLIVESHANGKRIVIFGSMNLDTHSIEQDMLDLNGSALSEVPENCIRLVADDNRLLIASDVVGLWPLYLARQGTSWLFASSAIVLSRLIGADLDAGWLATYMFAAQLPEVLQSRTPFAKIQRLEPGHVLAVQRRHASVRRYWRIPAEEISLREGAEVFRQAVVSAVDRRIDSDLMISADISGGFDSSIVAAIAARSLAAKGRKLDAITYHPANPAALGDVEYAEAVARSAGNVSLSRLELEGLPAPFQSLDCGLSTEEPGMATCTAPRLNSLLQYLRQLGTELHLTGHGADALVEPPTFSYLPDLWRAWRLRLLMTHASLAARSDKVPRWRRVALAARVSHLAYGDWLKAEVERIESIKSTRGLGWAEPLAAVPWATAKARALTNDVVSTFAMRAKPHSEAIGQHAAFSAVLSTARSSSLAIPLSNMQTIRLQFPYLDPPVLSAAFMVAPVNKVKPFHLKPIMSVAFSDLMPAGFFERAKKTSPWFLTSDLVQSMRSARPRLIEVIRESLLADLGLVRVDSLVYELDRACFGNLDSLGVVIDTLALELWLAAVMRVR